MNEKEMVDLLRLYRHDLMNDLQVVQGYASMGKNDKVREKLADCMKRFSEERNLMRLNIPKFTIWLIRFNSIHKEIRLSYHIRTDNINLLMIDELLLSKCKKALSIFNAFMYETEIYDGMIRLNQVESTIDLDFSLIGRFKHNTSVLSVGKDDTIEIRRENNKMNCHFSISF